MQVLIKKSTRNPIEILDGGLVETDTPTLFTDRATIESIINTTDPFDEKEYELCPADLLLQKKGPTEKEQIQDGIDFLVLNIENLRDEFQPDDLMYSQYSVCVDKLKEIGKIFK